MYKYIKGLGSIWVGELPPPTPSNNVIWMRIQRVDGKKGYHELLTWNVFENKWQHLSISELESNAATVDWVNRVIEEHNSNDQSHEDIRDTLRQCVEDIASVNPDEISAKIEAEKQARIASDNQLSTDINAEETRATNEETLIRQEFKEADQTILSTVNKSISDSLNSHNTSSSSHQDIRTLLSECVGLPEYNSSTYEITFTTKAGQKLIIDLPIEQLALKYNPETQSIEFQNGDGTTTSIPVSEFLTEYIGSNGTEIIVTIGENNSIKASLVNDSITLEKLAPEIRENLTSLVTESFVNEESIPAKANASISQSILTSVGNPSVSNNSDTVTIKVNKKTRASSTGEFGEEVSENLVIPSATVTNAGVMSATDKAKLDNIPENVSTLQLGETSTTAYAGDKGKLTTDVTKSLGSDIVTTLSASSNSTTAYINFGRINRSNTSEVFKTIDSYSAALPTATQEKAGVMSAADKTALDTMEFSSINLIDGSESITVSAPESNNYYSKNIPILGNVSAGDNFAVSIDAITDVAGVADTYTINIYDKSGSTRLSNTLSLSKDNRSGVFEILPTVDSQEAILRLFAGYSSETSNHTVRYDKVMLVHGNHPSKVWAPSVNDQKQAAIDGIQIGSNNLVNNSNDNWVEYATNNSGYIDNIIRDIDPIIRGKEISIRVELKGEDAQAAALGYEVAIAFADGTSQYIARYSTSYVPERGTFEKTYETHETVQDKEIKTVKIYPRFATDGGTPSGRLFIRHEFVSIGNKLPTTWIPSINDQKQAAIDGVQVGGVNLLDGSYSGEGWTGIGSNEDGVFSKGTSGANEVFMYSPECLDLEAGKEYTLSFYSKATSNTKSLEAYILFKSIGSDNINLQIPKTEDWSYNVFTFTPKVSGLRWIRFNNNGSSDGSIARIYITKPQVEEGNKATTWSLSVNDILSESLTQAKENDKNYLPLTGGTLRGRLTGGKGVSAFDEDETKTEFNATGKIGGNTKYSTPLLIKTKPANVNWNFQFEDKLNLLIGPQNGIPIKLYSTTSKSALYATELYQDNKIVATQEWVLQQLANYISKIGDSTISGTLTANAFKES